MIPVFVKKKVRKETSINEYNNEIRSNSNIKILLSETLCSTYLGGEYPPREREREREGERIYSSPHPHRVITFIKERQRDRERFFLSL